MTELTWLLDPTTGILTVEGLTTKEASALAGDLLPPSRDVNCARPLQAVLLPTTSPECLRISPKPLLRVARIYHGSVVDGPGRRSVVQVQGCRHACPGCFVPHTHPPTGGVLLDVAEVVALLLDRDAEPCDGVTITGGEPFLQPAALLALLQQLKARAVHTVVYTGYVIEALAQRGELQAREALALIDLLIDGPYVTALAQGAGEWRGSRNQRLIPCPGEVLEDHDNSIQFRRDTHGSNR